MNHMEALRAFTRVVELGTFSAAARDIRIRQSTVSKWVASLEDELGVQLLEGGHQEPRGRALGFVGHRRP